MQKCKLGGSGLQVKAFGLGCMGLNKSFHPFSEKSERFALLQAAAERVITFFDTTEVRGGFANDQLVGKSLTPILLARYLRAIIL